MSKNLKKRLLALLLAVVLCTALMLPGFAAVVPEDEGVETLSTNACPYHNPVYSHSTATYSYISTSEHYKVVTNYYFCQLCHTYESHTASSGKESHTLPCSKCGH